MSEYCERCNNIMDITRIQPNKTLFGTHTPSSISSDTETDSGKKKDYVEILKKLENDEKLTRDDLVGVDMKELLQTDYYKELNGKGKIRKNLVDMLEDAHNSDGNTNAYFICNNCMSTRRIPEGFCIYMKNQENTASQRNYDDESVYRNMIFQKTIPRTRNFKCTNESCPSLKSDIPTEAVFFRKPNTYEVVMVCCICSQVKYNT